MRAKLLLDSGRTKEAKAEFTNIVQNIVGDDSYSFLTLANISFKEAVSCEANQNNE